MLYTPSSAIGSMTLFQYLLVELAPYHSLKRIKSVRTGGCASSRPQSYTEARASKLM